MFGIEESCSGGLAEAQKGSLSRMTSLFHMFFVLLVCRCGLSKGALELTPEGHGRFSGTVSLENYGGFTSIRCAVADIAVSEGSKIQLRIKGDGKDYQFRVKHKARDYQSYITTFSTTGTWETIEIPLIDLYPSWRGQKLDMPNFDKSRINEFTFLIANKRNETFELLIDEIVLVP